VIGTIATGTDGPPAGIRTSEIYEDHAFHLVLYTRVDGDHAGYRSPARSPRDLFYDPRRLIKRFIIHLTGARADWSAYLARRVCESRPQKTSDPYQDPEAHPFVDSKSPPMCSEETYIDRGIHQVGQDARLAGRRAAPN
jgi:hypothetical protein